MQAAHTGRMKHLGMLWRILCVLSLHFLLQKHSYKTQDNKLKKYLKYDRFCKCIHIIAAGADV